MLSNARPKVSKSKLSKSCNLSNMSGLPKSAMAVYPYSSSWSSNLKRLSVCSGFSLHQSNFSCSCSFCRLLKSILSFEISPDRISFLVFSKRVFICSDLN